MEQQLVVVGTKVLTKDGTKIVAEVGECYDFGCGDFLIPIKFKDGGFAILLWQWFVGILSVWELDDEQDQELIINSLEMPTVVYSKEKRYFFSSLCKQQHPYACGIG